MSEDKLLDDVKAALYEAERASDGASDERFLIARDEGELREWLRALVERVERAEHEAGQENAHREAIHEDYMRACQARDVAESALAEAQLRIAGLESELSETARMRDAVLQAPTDISGTHGAETGVTPRPKSDWNGVAPSRGDSGQLCVELRDMGRLSGNAVYVEAAEHIEGLEKALREWQLGVGDTEMEQECARLHVEWANSKAEWAAAIRDVVALREALGLLTTLKPSLEIRADDPMGMAWEIEQFVGDRLADMTAERDRYREELASIDSMLGEADADDYDIVKAERDTALQALADLQGRTCETCAEQVHLDDIPVPVCGLTMEGAPCYFYCRTFGNTCGAWKEKEAK